ncbi:MAG: hypothetical protein Tsb0019_04590 [Roseibium sp.]
MTIDWNAILTNLGSTAVVVAAIAWMSKSLIGLFLSKDLESHKARIKESTELRLADIDRQAKEKLAQLQHELDSKMKLDEARRSAKDARVDRIRQEVELWASPILGSILELKSRLDNILYRDGYVALTSDTSQEINNIPEDWSIDYDYFLPSTVFLFCQYFCWIRLLEERLAFEIFTHQNEKDEFFKHARSVSRTLSSWPFPPCTEVAGQDFQVFTLQQRALGEALITRIDHQDGCMRVSVFLNKWRTEDEFRNLFSPLETMIKDLSPDTPRWVRLKEMNKKLELLEKECRSLLMLPQGE